ncbi:N(6)-adenine-specific methyltransferase METTL4-like [Ruditapes philippinarum]|uniref:N(6)-adenine-specific methyltransferase METTL4-like n=1 Tax=Ruditapes philippinarum TaxID=129788 RepID=UPI00295B5F9D|nr:N(6)-adenine-specific methyltransferase METTL4-like [Ruditapes philippinarum]XP_060605651.1 N(6)-adenine-specific methyltransferase METTL4-like [Ruditapes philippinarum]
MSVIVENGNGCIIDHHKASIVTIETPHNVGRDDRHGHQYKLKSDLFEIVEPYRMDSQFVKLQSADKNEDGRKNKRKRKRREPLNVGEKMAVDFHNEVKGYIETAYKSLLELGQKMSYFMTQSNIDLRDNNVAARKAALLDGTLHSFIDMCEQSDHDRNQECLAGCYTGASSCSLNCVGTQQAWNQECQQEEHDRLSNCVPTIQVSEVKDLSLFGTINVIWQNWDQSGRLVKCKGENYIIPENCTFLMSDISEFNKLGKALGKFDLLVMDPPWTNKSVKRKKKYHTIDNDMLLGLPLCDLMNPGCVVVVWVTNKQNHIHFVTEELFPSKNIRFTARWYWLKVTKTGQCVYDLESPHKRPYETLIIGKYHPVSMETQNATCDLDNARDSSQASNLKIDAPENDWASSKDNQDSRGCITDNKVIISVPCSLHSKKPPLTEVLRPYLPNDPKCMELFARNLLPGWTSWGNEVLLHQHESFFEEVI